ncbi:cation:proton antiporter [Rhodobacter sp. Har01]|uniref:cation:proton antiporter domain-containing protein n=1 Tax=Rhodobacter sp. Har01 TaxID=2883999 RepID=UPI001D06B946|nr:cation:proton antiporter [Rhodobacter sp. Har01]MCB6178651.1 cation:proton antiporter [Rhodobacter sp. Har01]
MESFLFQASLYLGAAVLLVPLAVRLGLGSVLGYLAAGILLGPVSGLAGAESQGLQHVAEFGVVMMLFLIGLELEPRILWDMRHRLLGLGGAQVVATTAAITLILALVGLDVRSALTIGLLLSLSSTAIVLQTLAEKNLMRGPGGRAAFSVLLMQDIAVVPILAVIPLLALPGIVGPTADLFGIVNPQDPAAESALPAAEPFLTFIQSLPSYAATLMTLALVAAIMLAGHFLSRPVFRFVHASRLPEMSTFVSLLIVLGIAFLMMLAGLSPALGTFVAGVVLANSEFRHQIEADIRPFKGLLLGLFFTTVGIGIDFDVFLRAPGLIVGAALGLIALKAALLFGLGMLSGLKGKDRFLFSLALAQSGEFGFLIVGFARSEGALSLGTGQVVMLVISLSMLVTPLLFLLYDLIARQIVPGGPARKPDAIDQTGRVLIAGIGRFGQVVNRLVRSSGVSTVVLDSDMAVIEQMRRFGVKGFFGDPSRPELLEAAGLATAEVLVVAVGDRDNVLKIVRHARSLRPDLHIVARARDRVHVYELYQAGANDIVRETFDSSVRAGRYVLENMGFTEYEASQLSQTFWRLDRAGMRDLASLWVPGQPSHLNPAYVARVRQLDDELASALGLELEQTRPAAGASAEVQTETKANAPSAARTSAEAAPGSPASPAGPGSWQES